MISLIYHRPDICMLTLFLSLFLTLIKLNNTHKYQILKRPEEALSLLERFLPSGQLVMFPHNMMEKLVREHRVEWGRKT